MDETIYKSMRSSQAAMKEDFRNFMKSGELNGIAPDQLLSIYMNIVHHRIIEANDNKQDYYDAAAIMALTGFLNDEYEFMKNAEAATKEGTDGQS